MAPEQVEAFLRHTSPGTCEAGATLTQSPASSSGSIHLLTEGWVRLELRRDDGAITVLGFQGAGEMIGEPTSAPSMGPAPTVVALQPVTYLWLAGTTLQGLMQQVPQLAINVLAVTARRLRHAHNRIGTMATLDVPARVTVNLVELATEFGEPAGGRALRIPIPMTQSVLAEFVGASRERVNQVLGGLKAHGLLEVDERRMFTIIDPERLVRHAALEAGALAWPRAVSGAVRGSGAPFIAD
jgi:CRP-like cAMP-binding protein